MAAHIFGRSVGGDIDTMVQRLEVQPRPPGVIDNRTQAPVLGPGGQRGDILHLEGDRAGGLEVEHPGFRGAQLVQLIERAQRVVVGHADADARQIVVTEGAHRAVDAVDHQQMIAFAEQGEQRRRACEQAGADRHAAETVFQFAEGFLPVDGDVTAVDAIGLGAEFARLAADLAHMVHAVVEVGRASIDRRIDGAYVEALHLVAVAACDQFGDVFHNRLLKPGTLRRLDPLSRGRGQAEFQRGSPSGWRWHKPALRGAAQELVRNRWGNQGRILNSIFGRYRRPMSRFLPRVPLRGIVPQFPLNPWHQTISDSHNEG